MILCNAIVADGGAEVASCENVFSVEPLAHVITVLNNSFCTILVLGTI